MRHVLRKPTTMTAAETKAILEATGRSEDDARDHLILAIALGAGLRVSEIVGLNVGDVMNGKGAMGVWTLRPETTKGNRGGTVALPDRLRRKVSAFLRRKREHGEALGPLAPVFVSRGGGRRRKRGGGRLSVRAVQSMFHSWQQRCGFDRRVNFHALRHSYCTNLWRMTGDLRLVQQAARHSDPGTTAVYTHATVEDVLRAVQDLPC